MKLKISTLIVNLIPLGRLLINTRVLVAGPLSVGFFTLPNDGSLECFMVLGGFVIQLGSSLTNSEDVNT